MPRPSRLVATLIAAAAAALPAGFLAAPAASASVTDEVLSSAESFVTCGEGVGDGRRTVLLIHGTGATSEEAWSWNWERTLPAMGYGVCTVDLPGRSLTNFVGSAEHVAGAVRHVHRKAGRKISVMGHSQGGTLVAWAAKFFPDVTWQLILGSRHLEALRNAPFPMGPSFSSIYTTADQLVFPQPAGSTLPGASNVSLQDVCGVRPVEHGGILADSVAHVLVTDALEHAGPTNLSRIPSATRLASCASTTQPGTDPSGIAKFAPTLAALLDGTLLGGQPDVDREPALPAYVERYAS